MAQTDLDAWRSAQAERAADPNPDGPPTDEDRGFHRSSGYRKTKGRRTTSVAVRLALPSREEKLQRYRAEKQEALEREAFWQTDAARLLKESVKHARALARDAMERRPNQLLESLRIQARKRWVATPPYGHPSFDSFLESFRLYLEHLPREVEWSFWMVDQGELLPSPLQQGAMRLLHRLAETEALGAVEEDGLRWSYARFRDESTGQFKLRVILVGFSYELWGETRYPPPVPATSKTRPDELAVRAILRRAGEAAGYTWRAFRQPFGRGRLSGAEKSRREALREAATKAKRKGATHSTIAEALGWKMKDAEKQVARLLKTSPPKAAQVGA